MHLTLLTRDEATKRIERAMYAAFLLVTDRLIPELELPAHVYRLDLANGDQFFFAACTDRPANLGHFDAELRLPKKYRGMIRHMTHIATVTAPEAK